MAGFTLPVQQGIRRASVTFPSTSLIGLPAAIRYIDFAQSAQF
jgi:hypothetical protein